MNQQVISTTDSHEEYIYLLWDGFISILYGCFGSWCG